MDKFRWAWVDEEGNEVDEKNVVGSYIPPLDLSPHQEGELSDIKIVTLKKVKLDAKV